VAEGAIAAAVAEERIAAVAEERIAVAAEERIAAAVDRRAAAAARTLQRRVAAHPMQQLRIAAAAMPAVVVDTLAVVVDTLAVVVDTLAAAVDTSNL
jgi:hypothetical protein